jgi:aspartyl-tRNA(Asn)/glutamyl-tRNA(Gln) amidotransferase subunit A
MAIEQLIARRLTGKPLALVAQTLRSPSVAALGVEVLRRELGVDKLEALESAQDELELDLAPLAARPPRELTDPLDAPTAPVWVTTSEALTSAYRERRVTPSQLVEKLLREADSIARRQPFLRCFWMRDDATAQREAEASTLRYAQGAPLGPLDGVPFAVKEHIGIRGFPCRSGHDLPSDELSPEDSTLVARLRKAGAILVGQTQMTELGLSPLGINPKRPALRNPHHIERVAGGSSTGSGIATALGLVPFAVGTDGGGSVRIPAALCGVFGLKPTYGRVSRAASKLGGSLTHAGPIASNVLDLAHFLDAVAGPDPRDVSTLRAPPQRGKFADAARRRVRGLTLGVDEHELRDADVEVVRAVERSIKAIESCGVRLVDVRLPLASAAFAIGSLTIAAETRAAEAVDFQRHGAAFGYDLQVLMALSAQLGGADYLRAQKLRQRLRKEAARVFSEVDALALPTTMSTALPVSTSEERYGRVDARATRQMCRHTFLANLVGLPAGSAPIGLDSEGLPIGLQLVADAWDEGTLIALMAELSRLDVARSARPAYHVELLT